MSAAPLITVFTPTFNRAHTLHRVFDSLRSQTLRDFEWLVVDDGSTDRTAEIVAAWAQVADFPVVYVRQKHAGKHVAHNRGLREARGRFFALIDSDDAMLPHALERLAHHWEAIPDGDKPRFSGVRGLCSDQHGRIIGDRFPQSPLDSNLRELHYVYRLRGEKWGMALTEVMRRFQFPEIAGTNFIPEGVVWLDMARYFQHRSVNEVFRIYYVGDTEAGAKLTDRRLAESAPGRMHYYVWLLNNDIEYLFRSPEPFLKAALMLPVVARYARRPFRQVWGELRKVRGRALVLLVYPLSMLFYLFDRARLRPGRSEMKPAT